VTVVNSRTKSIPNRICHHLAQSTMARQLFPQNLGEARKITSSSDQRISTRSHKNGKLPAGPAPFPTAHSVAAGRVRHLATCLPSTCPQPTNDLRYMEGNSGSTLRGSHVVGLHSSHETHAREPPAQGFVPSFLLVNPSSTHHSLSISISSSSVPPLLSASALSSPNMANWDRPYELICAFSASHLI
jgi:hypothetical protein